MTDNPFLQMKNWSSNPPPPYKKKKKKENIRGVLDLYMNLIEESFTHWHDLI